MDIKRDTDADKQNDTKSKSFTLSTPRARRFSERLADAVKHSVIVHSESNISSPIRDDSMMLDTPSPKRTLDHEEDSTGCAYPHSPTDPQRFTQPRKRRTLLPHKRSSLALDASEDDNNRPPQQEQNRGLSTDVEEDDNDMVILLDDGQRKKRGESRKSSVCSSDATMEEDDSSSSRQQLNNNRRRKLRPQTAVMPPTKGGWSSLTKATATTISNDIAIDEDASTTFHPTAAKSARSSVQKVKIKPVVLGVTSGVKDPAAANDHQRQPRRKQQHHLQQSLTRKLSLFLQSSSKNSNLIDLSKHSFVPPHHSSTTTTTSTTQQPSSLSSSSSSPVIVIDSPGEEEDVQMIDSLTNPTATEPTTICTSDDTNKSTLRENAAAPSHEVSAGERRDQTPFTEVDNVQNVNEEAQSHVEPSAGTTTSNNIFLGS